MATLKGKGNDFYGKCQNCHEDLIGEDLIMKKLKLNMMGSKVWILTCSKCQHIIGTAV